VPDDLLELAGHFALWRDEKGRKVPYQTNGKRASTTSDSHWHDFDQAAEILTKYPGRYSGMAYRFIKSDATTGIDLDDVLDAGGAVKECARGVIERFSDTYMEVSPSGKGVKIWARGSIPSNVPGIAIGAGASIEMYDHARYFTLTGQVFNGAPLQLEHHEEDLLALHKRLTEGSQKVWPLQPLNGGRIPYGHQHSTLISIAGTLRARRVCDEAILACLLTVNAHQCERPGAPEAIARIVRSTRTWANR
jgi:primase-polymerase (primpol)-like protein